MVTTVPDQAAPDADAGEIGTSSAATSAISIEMNLVFMGLLGSNVPQLIKEVLWVNFFSLFGLSKPACTAGLI
jgi:hypothetical protein